MNDGYLPCWFYSSSLHAIIESARQPPLPCPHYIHLPGEACSGGAGGGQHLFACRHIETSEAILAWRGKPGQMPSLIGRLQLPFHSSVHLRLRSLLEPPGTSWSLLENPGTSWSLLEAHHQNTNLTSAFDHCVVNLSKSRFCRQQRNHRSRKPWRPGSGVRIIAVLDSTGHQTLHHALHRNIIGILLLGLGIIPQLKRRPIVAAGGFAGWCSSCLEAQTKQF